MAEAVSPEEGKVWTYHGYRLDMGNFVTAMVHYYRAEITRVNLWRSRLDTTTNWAVATTGGALTFAFSSAQNPHFVLLLVLLLVLIFLNIEGRRYTYYSLWYHRARLLETDFFGAMIAAPFAPAPDWGDALGAQLRDPTFPISRWEAVGNRYRRNYAFIVSVLLLSWLLKLAMHPTPATSAAQIVARAAIGRAIPGPWVVGAVAAIYTVLGVLTLVGYLRYRREGALYVELSGRKPERFGGEPTPNLAILITTRRDEMGRRLMHELGRGVTALDGEGMYTGTRRQVLLCAVTDVQVSHLQRIAREVDPDSFVVVTEARDVQGRHFRHVEQPPS